MFLLKLKHKMRNPYDNDNSYIRQQKINKMNKRQFETEININIK